MYLEKVPKKNNPWFIESNNSIKTFIKMNYFNSKIFTYLGRNLSC